MLSLHKSLQKTQEEVIFVNSLFESNIKVIPQLKAWKESKY